MHHLRRFGVIAAVLVTVIATLAPSPATADVPGLPTFANPWPFGKPTSVPRLPTYHIPPTTAPCVAEINWMVKDGPGHRMLHGNGQIKCKLGEVARHVIIQLFSRRTWPIHRAALVPGGLQRWAVTPHALAISPGMGIDGNGRFVVGDYSDYGHFMWVDDAGWHDIYLYSPVRFITEWHTS